MIETIYRQELKYIIPVFYKKDILSLLDPNFISSYNVNSIYFDQGLKFFNQCLDGSFHKKKYRLRTYDNGSPLFWESKIKNGDDCRKSRINLENNFTLSEENIKPHIEYIKKTSNLSLISFVRYKRYLLKEMNGLRITLDDNIKFGYCPFSKLRTLTANPILEIKTNDSVPNKLISFFNDYNIQISSYSKYQQATQRLIKENDELRF